MPDTFSGYGAWRIPKSEVEGKKEPYVPEASHDWAAMRRRVRIWRNKQIGSEAWPSGPMLTLRDFEEGLRRMWGGAKKLSAGDVSDGRKT